MNHSINLPVWNTTRSSYSIICPTIRSIKGVFYKTCIAIFIISEAFGFFGGLFRQPPTLEAYNATAILLGLTLIIMKTVVMAPMMISIYRTLLLDETPNPKFFAKLKTDYSIPLIGYLLVFSVSFYIANVVALMIAAQFTSYFVVVYLLLIIAVGVQFARFTFIYPAISTGTETSILVSNKQTKGNRAKIVVVSALTAFPFVLINLLLVEFLRLYPTPLLLLLFSFDLVASIILSVQLAITAVASAMMYKELVVDMLLSDIPKDYVLPEKRECPVCGITNEGTAQRCRRCRYDFSAEQP